MRKRKDQRNKDINMIWKLRINKSKNLKGKSNNSKILIILILIKLHSILILISKISKNYKEKMISYKHN